MKHPYDKHDCPLLNHEVFWGDCWVIQDIRNDNTDMEFAPEMFDLNQANLICEKCRWYSSRES